METQRENPTSREGEDKIVPSSSYTCVNRPLSRPSGGEGVFGEGTVVLLLVLAAGILGGNELVTVSAAVTLILQLSGMTEVFQFLDRHGVEVGVIFLMLGLLLPFATERLPLGETVKGLFSLPGVITVVVGIAAAYFAAEGVAMLQSHPELLIGLLVGSVIGVSYFGGIPAGPLVAAGMVALIYKLVQR